MSSFNNTVAEIRKYLRDDDSYNFIVGRVRDKVEKSVKKMEMDVHDAMEDENPDIKDEDKRVVSDVLQFLNEVIVLKETDPKFDIFTSNYLLLVSNWNRLANSKTVDKRFQVVKQTMNYRHSMAKSVEMLQRILAEFKNVRDFNPPIFDVSKHYLQELQKKYDKKHKEE